MTAETKALDELVNELRKPLMEKDAVNLGEVIDRINLIQEATVAIYDHGEAT